MVFAQLALVKRFERAPKKCVGLARTEDSCRFAEGHEKRGLGRER
jgi:hypothetical protein